MTGPRFAPVDTETGDLLDLLAEDPDYSRFLRLCEVVALAHDGRVTVNAVRTLAKSLGLDMNSRRYSAFWNRATGKNGPLVNTDEWEVCDDREAKNSGKPQRVRRWVG